MISVTKKPLIHNLTEFITYKGDPKQYNTALKDMEDEIRNVDWCQVV